MDEQGQSHVTASAQRTPEERRAEEEEEKVGQTSTCSQTWTPEKSSADGTRDELRRYSSTVPTIRPARRERCRR